MWEAFRMHFHCACISATLSLKAERLTESAVEDVLYDSLAMRAFVRIGLGSNASQDETTVLKLRQVRLSSINY